MSIYYIRKMLNFMGLLDYNILLVNWIGKI